MNIGLKVQTIHYNICNLYCSYDFDAQMSKIAEFIDWNTMYGSCHLSNCYFGILIYKQYMYVLQRYAKYITGNIYVQ